MTIVNLNFDGMYMTIIFDFHSESPPNR